MMNKLQYFIELQPCHIILQNYGFYLTIDKITIWRKYIYLIIIIIFINRQLFNYSIVYHNCKLNIKVFFEKGKMDWFRIYRREKSWIFIEHLTSMLVGKQTNIYFWSNKTKSTLGKLFKQKISVVIFKKSLQKYCCFYFFWKKHFWNKF